MPPDRSHPEASVPTGSVRSTGHTGAVTCNASPDLRDGGSSPRAGDPAFLAFLLARRDEEANAVDARRAHGTPEQARQAEAGIAVLDDLIATVRAGRDIDSTSLHLIKIGYGHHHDFRPQWHATHG